MVRRDAGQEMPVGYEILEPEEPTRLVLRSDPKPERGMPNSVITRLDFRDLGDGRTQIEFVDRLYPEGAGHAEMGWNSSFDRLAAKLRA